MPLCRHSVGTSSEQTHTQLVRKLSATVVSDPDIKSGISVRELISTLKKKKKRRRGMNGPKFSPKSSEAGRKSSPHHQ